ncbi:MAG: hypothetical protein ACJ0KI_09210 [Dehalococcoidia bacterium]
MDRYKYYLNIGLEFSWLTVALFLPLLLTTESSFISQDLYSRFEVPKTIFLKVFAAIVLILWMLKESTSSSGAIYSIFTSTVRLRAIKMDSAFFIVTAIILLVFSTFIATILSASPTTSMWGHQPGNDPFSMYSLICYTILFGALARNVQTPAQIDRILIVFVFSATLVAVYGIFEYFGMDLVTTNEAANFSRISSTLGNPLVAGSFFVISAGITLTSLFHTLHPGINKSGWRRFRVGLCSFSFICQFTALSFTGSTGPLVSFVFLIVLFAIGTFFLDASKHAIKNLIVLASVLLIGSATIFMSDLTKPDNIDQVDSSQLDAQANDEKNLRQESQDILQVFISNTVSDSLQQGPIATELGIHSLENPQASPTPASGASTDPTLNTNPAVISEGGIKGRIYTWSNTAKASLQRNSLEQGRDYGKVTRFIAGYGPELMEFAFLQTALPYGPLILPATPDQAHNIFLHYLIEQGLLGLLSSVFVFASPLLIIWVAIRSTDKHGQTKIWVIVGGSVTLLAYGLEQQAGITKVTGYTIYFMLLGIVYASIRQQQAPHETKGAVEQILNVKINLKMIIPLFTGSLIVLMVSIITVTQNLNYLRAGFIAADGVQSFNQGDVVTGYNSFDKAIKLSPRIPVYFHYQNAALKQMADRSDSLMTVLPPRCGIFREPEKITECIYSEIYINAKQAYLNNGYNWNTTFEAAQSAFDIKQDEEAVGLYKIMLNQAPNSYPLKNHVGYIHYLLSNYDEAQNMFAESLKLTSVNEPEARTAMMYKGLIQAKQGEISDAYDTLLIALELYLEARTLQYGYATDPQENKDILSISMELINLAEILGKEPPVRVE